MYLCRMKKPLMMAAGLLLIMTGRLASESPRVTHVIVISVDGFRPDFYLDSSWQAIRIRAFIVEGVFGKGGNRVFPSFAYPSHTTMVTGVQPAVHGIYYNTGPG